MKNRPVYLLLFTLYPVLALWSQNIQEVSFGQIWRVILASFSLTVLIWVAGWLIFWDMQRAGLITMVALIIFFSYGHLYEHARAWSFEVARHRYLLPLVITLFFTWVSYVIRAKRVSGLAGFFNLFSLILLLAPVYTIINFEIRSYNNQVEQAAVVDQDPGEARPDIYYVIVDGYGRKDVLDEYYHFDNSAFLQYLERKGFYVAGASTSNYRRTTLSLTSSLNMAYIQALLPDLDPKTKDFTELFELLRHSAVRQTFAESGYRFVTVDNDLKTTIADAEVLVTPDPVASSERVNLTENGYSISLNSFEGLFIQTSLANLWVQWQVKRGESSLLDIIQVEAPYNRHRMHVLFAIDSVAKLADIDGDNFVFIHIVAPHPLFVFGPNGEQIRHDRLFSIADGPYSQGSREDYIRGYTGQVAFINERLKDAIDYLLEHSETEPIIIIQGDHGPKGFTDEHSGSGDFTENFAVLNAYYFPGQRYEGLYESISPVNSFRVVFNELFGRDLPMLDDKSYFSTVARPFDFVDVTQQVR